VISKALKTHYAAAAAGSPISLVEIYTFYLSGAQLFLIKKESGVFFFFHYVYRQHLLE